MAVNYTKNNNKIASLETQLKEAKAYIKQLTAETLIVKNALDGTLHEIRRLIAEISSNAELLSKELGIYKNDVLNELSNTIFFTSGLVSSRLAFTDLELNPKAITFQSYITSGIYKKFEKTTHILKQRAKSKQISLNLTSRSFMEVDTLPSFELVPFCIIENAIKYSPNNQVVQIHFDESPNMRALKVQVKSIGPMLDSSETNNIFDRGVRGKNAKRLSVSGEGLGLFLVRFLCDLHSVDIKITSDTNLLFSQSNIPYSHFCVELNFTK